MSCEHQVMAVRRFGKCPSEDDGAEQQHHADDRRLANMSLAEDEHVEAHKHADGDRHADAECAPRTFSERVDDGDAEAGKGHDEDEQNGKGTDRSGQWADLGARDGGEGLAAAAGTCPAPHRWQPATSQGSPGANPNCAASTGPTSGPAPAIAAKWCPKRTHRLMGWKFDPSYFECAGVTRASSSAITL